MDYTPLKNQGMALFGFVGILFLLGGLLVLPITYAIPVFLLGILCLWSASYLDN